MLYSLLGLFSVFSLQVGADAGALDPAEFLGTWHAVLEQPTSEGDRELRFALWQDGGGLIGGLRSGESTALLEGEVDRNADRLILDVLSGNGSTTLELYPAKDGLAGRLANRSEFIGLSARRSSREVPDDLRLEIDLNVEGPVTIDRDGLPDFMQEAIQPVLDAWIARERPVGLSVAFTLDFEVLDIRSFGWQSFAQRIPASAKTRYRWGSISKSVTAVAALQLVEAGRLDLQRDVREYVPEFPEKRWTLTSEHLLCHQGGVVHYPHGPIRTERTYDDPNPFRSRILALDMFKESPLLFEPGTRYSYTTHGFALLGAVVERAGEQRFSEQVHERIVKPLGMTTLQPDFHQSQDIPDQTTGYSNVRGGRVIDSGDSNVAWKLAGGGFISNVEDLALFGLGLMGDRLLTESMRADMFTARRTNTGGKTGYGWGVGVEIMEGFKAVGHGGSQRKTKTYLLLAPEIGLGVAVMCNTESVDPGNLAHGIIGAMIE